MYNPLNFPSRTCMSMNFFPLFFLVDVPPTRQVLAIGDAPHSNYDIDTNQFRLQINHFSWFSMAFRRDSSTTEITMCCLPLLPRCMSNTRKVMARVHVYKFQQGMEEVHKTMKDNAFSQIMKYHQTYIFSWEPEGRWCFSTMVRWEPAGRYSCTKSLRKHPPGSQQNIVEQR